MKRHRRVSLALVVTALLGLPASGARAAGPDFVDETLVAGGLGGRELGIELATDSRVDRDYRLQGWFSPEVEVGVTRDWLVEGSGSFLNRGRGIEFAGGRAETRYDLLRGPRWPAQLAAAVEYEVETPAAKHLVYERMVSYRAIVLRTFANSVLASFNWGIDRRITPFPRHKPFTSFGVRYPENRALCIGFTYRSKPIEREARLGPELRIRLPNRSLLRLGGTAGRKNTRYRFIGRAILELDL